MMSARTWIACAVTALGLMAALPLGASSAPVPCPEEIRAVPGGARDALSNGYDDGTRGEGEQYAPGELIIRLAEGAGRDGLNCLMRELGAAWVAGGPGSSGVAGVPGAVVLLLPPRHSVRRTAALLIRPAYRSLVRSARPDFAVEPQQVRVNDPLFPVQWGIGGGTVPTNTSDRSPAFPMPPFPSGWTSGASSTSVRAPQGWTALESVRANRAVRVAVVDNSLMQHPDLEQNVAPTGSRVIAPGIIAGGVMRLLRRAAANPAVRDSRARFEIGGQATCGFGLDATPEEIAEVLSRLSINFCLDQVLVGVKPRQPKIGDGVKVRTVTWLLTVRSGPGGTYRLSTSPTPANPNPPVSDPIRIEAGASDVYKEMTSSTTAVRDWLLGQMAPRQDPRAWAQISKVPRTATCEGAEGCRAFAISFRVPLQGDVPQLTVDGSGLTPYRGAPGDATIVQSTAVVDELAGDATIRRLRFRVNAPVGPPPSVGPDPLANLAEAVTDITPVDRGRWPGPGEPGARHGQHIAGIIAATGGNGIGMTGAVGPYSGVLLNGVVIGDRMWDLTTAVALRYAAADLGAKVVNVSLGWGGVITPPPLADPRAPDPAPPSLTQQAISNVPRGNQALFVVASGNDGGNVNATAPRGIVGWEPCRPKGDGVTQRPAWPGGQSRERGGTASFLQMPDGTYDRGNLLCVGAVGPDRRVASFSNWGEDVVDVAAPGTNIIGTGPDATYAAGNGTSYAAPIVAGIAAMVYEAHPDAQPWLVKCAIMSAATSAPIKAPDTSVRPFTGYERGRGVGQIRDGRAFTVHGIPLAAEAISVAGVLTRRIAAARAAPPAQARYPTCVQKRRYVLGVFGGGWRDTPVRTR